MSQDQDDNLEFCVDSDVDEKSECSSSSFDNVDEINNFRFTSENLDNTVDSNPAFGLSRNVVDKDSSASKPEVEDMQAGDENKCLLELSNQYQATKQVDVRQKEKIPGVPPKCQFPFSEETSKPNPDLKKHAISTKRELNSAEYKRIVPIESNLSSMPAANTPEELDKQYNRATSEENNEKQQHLSQQFHPQNPITQISPKELDVPILTLDTPKEVDIHQEIKASVISRKQRCHTSDEISKTPSDYKNPITSTKPDQKTEENTRTKVTDLRVPPFREFFTPEKFEKEFSRNYDKNNNENSKQSPHQSKQIAISQSSQKQTVEPRFSLDAAKQIDIDKETILGTPTKEKYPSSYQNSKPQSDSQKHNTSIKIDEAQLKSETDRSNRVRSELKFPLRFEFISPKNFEKESASKSGKDEKNSQHSLHQSGLSSQDPSSSQHRMGDRNIALGADKQANVHTSAKICLPLKKRKYSSLDENLESQADSKTDITFTKPVAKVEGRTRTTSELNIPSPHMIFSPEKFEKEFARNYYEVNNENSKQSSEQSELISQSSQNHPTSQSSQNQTDDPNFFSDVAKQVDVHKETSLGTPTKQQGRSSAKNSKTEQNSQKHSTSIKLDETRQEDETERNPRITVELKLPPFSKFLSSGKFEKGSASQSVEDVENPQHSLHQSDLSPQDPNSPQKQMDDTEFTLDSAKQTNTHPSARICSTPKKRRHGASDENLELQPNSKKPVAKVKGRTKTNSEFYLPSPKLIFSPEKFELEFQRTTDQENKENIQHSLQELSPQNTDQPSQNDNLDSNANFNSFFWNALSSKDASKLLKAFAGKHAENFVVENPPQLHSLTDPTLGTSNPLEDPKNEPPPDSDSDSSIGYDNMEFPPEFSEISVVHSTAFDVLPTELSTAIGGRSTEFSSLVGQFQFHEFASVVEQHYLRNLNTRIFLIMSGLSLLENRIHDLNNHFTTISLLLETRCDFVRSRTLAERRASARRYHRERQFFSNFQLLIDIFRKLEGGMTEILNDIRYNLSIGSHEFSNDSQMSMNINSFKARVKKMFNHFRKKFQKEFHAKMNSYFEIYEGIFSNFCKEIETMFQNIYKLFLNTK